MKALLAVALGASALALSACGGNGDDALADNVEDAAEMQADNLEAVADNTTNEVAADSLDAQADAVREAGDAKADAIDDSDVNAEAMTPAQKEAVVNGQ